MLIHITNFVIYFLRTYAGIVQGPDSTFIISRVSRLTSTVETTSHHQWHHDFFNIGLGTDVSVPMPVVNNSKSSYRFDIERFDNGSQVYCKAVDDGLTVNIKNNLLINCGFQTMKLYLEDNGYYGVNVDKISEYHENERFTFACAKHPFSFSESISDVFVGWLTPNSDYVSLITRGQDTINVAFTLDKKYNSYIICCIYYITTKFISNTDIQRYVTDKTRLIWKENNDHQKTINSTGIAVNTESKPKTTEDVINHSTNASNPFEDEPTSERTDFVIPEQGLSDNAHTPAAHNSTADIDSHEHKGQDVDISPCGAVRRIGDQLSVLCKVPYPIDSCRMKVGTTAYRLIPGYLEGDVVYSGLGLKFGHCGAQIKNIKEEWNGTISCIIPSREGNTEVVATMRLLVAKNNDPPITINNGTNLGVTEATEADTEHLSDASNPFADAPTSEKTDFVIPEQGLSDNAHTPAAHNSTADIDSHEHKGNSNLLLGVVVAVVLVVIVVLIGTVLVVVKRRTSSSGRPGLQQNTVWSPFYVNDLFREECDREIRNIEEHHYEEIN